MCSRLALVLVLIAGSLAHTGCVGAAIGGSMAVIRLATGGFGGKDAGQGNAYRPALQLTESPRTIEARVRFEPLVNVIPPSDSDRPRGDQELTESALEGELVTDLVQLAVLTDFRTNFVATSIRLHEPNPELVVRGALYQFAEYRSRPWYAKIPILERLFNERVEGGASIELRVLTSDGELIGLYSGESRFSSEEASWETLPKNQRTPGKPLNRAFTETMRQIRAKMLADDRLMNGPWRKLAHQ